MPDLKITTFSGYNTKEHGQKGTELVMHILGPRGAIVWIFSTGIAPQGVYPPKLSESILLNGVNINPASNMGITAHSELTAQTAHEEDSVMSDSCTFLSGRACVCDYQTRIDKRPMIAFACEGFDGVEKVLKTIYKEHYEEEFSNAQNP